MTLTVSHLGDPRVDRRCITRASLSRGALLFFKGQPGARGCCIIDISPAGVRLLSPRLSLLPMVFDLTFDNFATVQRYRLAWRRGDLLGGAFDIPNARQVSL